MPAEALRFMPLVNASKELALELYCAVLTSIPAGSWWMPPVSMNLGSNGLPEVSSPPENGAGVPS